MTFMFMTLVGPCSQHNNRALISNSIFRPSSIELKSCQESIFKTDAGDKLDYDFHYRLPTHRLLVVLSCHMFSVLFMTLPLGMSVGGTGIEIRLFLYYYNTIIGVSTQRRPVCCCVINYDDFRINIIRVPFP